MDHQVVLTSFVYEHDAELLAAELLAEGIDALVRKDDCGGMRPGITNERGVEVLVPAADLPTASEVLRRGESIAPETAPEAKRGNNGCLSFLITLLIGLGAGYVLAHGVNYWQTGRVDLVGVRFFEDRNGDGEPDLVNFYGKGDQFIGGKSDENFDGKWDFWWKNENAIQTEFTRDSDFNGVVDARARYEHGVVAEVDWRPTARAR